MSIALPLHSQSIQSPDRTISESITWNSHASADSLSPLITPQKNAVEQELDIDLNSNYLLLFSWHRFPDIIDSTHARITPTTELQVSADSAFAVEPIVDTFYRTNDTIQLINGLQFNQRYFWRIRAWYGLSNGSWSEIWTFTTAASPKQYPPFVRISPENGNPNAPMTIQRGGYPTLKFSWKPYPKRIHDDGSVENPYYLFQIGLDSISVATGKPSIQRTFGKNDSLGYVLSGLNPYKKYFWRMRTGYVLGGTGWSDIWSFTGGPGADHQATVKQIQQVDAASLYLADSLQGKGLPSFQQSKLQNFLYSITVQCIVPPGVLTKGDLTLIAADTGSTGGPWHELMVQIDPFIDGMYSDYTKLGIPPEEAESTRSHFSDIHTGDQLQLDGFVTETPVNAIMSNTVFKCVRLKVLGSSSLSPPPEQAASSDFYHGSNINFSNGESYEGSIVELHGLTVHAIKDINAGTFDAIDGGGNTILMADLSCWFTLAGHRNPASTYILPQPGFHINTLRGVIVTLDGKYCIAPLLPGDVDIVAIAHHMILGYAFNDKNQDRTANTGEGRISNIAVSLDGKLSLNSVTDSSGFFAFAGLDSGSYSLACQSLPYPWNPDPEIIGSSRITFTENPETVKVLFGFYRPWNHVNGKVFVDLNENGFWNTGEPGLSNWKVQINGFFNDVTMTDSIGNYSFNEVERGLSYVTVTAQPTWEQVYPRLWESYIVGNDTLGTSYHNVNFAIHQIPVRIKLLLTVHDNSFGKIQKMFWGNRGGASYGIWGVDPRASSIDFSEEELELPPTSYPQSLRFFDARFQDPNSDSSLFGEGSWIDMRDFISQAQIDTHFVTFLPGYIEGGDYPMTLGWDKTQASASYSGNVYIVDPKGVITNMKETDSLIISDRTIKSVLLIAQGPKLPSSSRLGWHLVSVPSVPLTDAVNDVFQLAQSEPYAYNKKLGYVVSKPLKPRQGYWLKCIPDKRNLYDFGPPISLPETLALSPGWNIIGAAGIPFSVSNIRTSPPDIIGIVWSHRWVYEATDSLRPFEGYWVKSDRAGSIIFGAAPAKSTAATKVVEIFKESYQITIEGSSNQRHSLYLLQDDGTTAAQVDLSRFDLPPLPPRDGSDIRFCSGRNIEIVSSKETVVPIQVTGAIEYPLTIQMQEPLSSGSLDVVLMVGSRSYPLSNRSTVTIADSGEQLAIRASFRNAAGLPKQYELDQNFPNPFNPGTTIKYTLPVSTHVLLKVYNLLGQEIATLVDGQQEAGYKFARFETTDLPSGVYIYSLRAGNFSNTKKMILLR